MHSNYVQSAVQLCTTPRCFIMPRAITGTLLYSTFDRKMTIKHMLNHELIKIVYAQIKQFLYFIFQHYLLHIPHPHQIQRTQKDHNPPPTLTFKFTSCHLHNNNSNNNHNQNQAQNQNNNNNNNNNNNANINDNNHSIRNSRSLYPEELQQLRSIIIAIDTELEYNLL